MARRRSASQPCETQPWLGKLARADDGDEFVALGAPAAAVRAVRDRARDLVALDLAERGGLDELLGLAIGGGHRGAALGAGLEATVDAVAVGIAGDNEHAPFRLRGSEHCGGERETEDNTHGYTHGCTTCEATRRS